MSKLSDKSPYVKVDSKKLKEILRNPSKKVKLLISGLVIGTFLLVGTSIINNFDQSIIEKDAIVLNLENLLTEEEIMLFFSTSTDSYNKIKGFNQKTSIMEIDRYSKQKYLIEVTDLHDQKRMAICKSDIGNHKVGDKTVNDIISYIEISTGQIIAQAHANNPFSEDNCELCNRDKIAVPTSVHAIYEIPLEFTQGLTADQIYTDLREGKINHSTLNSLQFVKEDIDIGKKR